MARTKNTARLACISCKKGIGSDLQRCMSCKKAWHTDCASTTLRVLGTCENCESDSESDNSRNLIIAEESESTVSSLVMSEISGAENSTQESSAEACYIVDRILNHRVQGAKRTFLVEWEGGDTTWEEEHQLDGCVDTLNDYISTFNRSHFRQLEPTKLIPLNENRVGLTRSQRLSSDAKENWVTIDQIIDCIQLYRQKEYWKHFGCNLPIVSLEKFDGLEDNIVLIQEGYHCFVALCYTTGVAYLADGNDQYLNESKIRDRVQSKLPNFLILPLSTTFTAKQDRCGAAATIIALELGRLHGGKLMKSIQINSQVKARIMNHLHKYESKNCIEMKASSFRNAIICDLCGKRFQNGKMSKLNMHKVREHSVQKE